MPYRVADHRSALDAMRAQQHGRRLCAAGRRRGRRGAGVGSLESEISMPFTSEQINFRAIPLNAESNLSRTPGKRVVFRWDCPGEHLYGRETIATEDEPRLSEEAITDDPYCHYCRKARSDPA